jgi:protein-disulfide isomerase
MLPIKAPELSVIITRRDFALGTSAVALSLTLAGWSGFVPPALAQQDPPAAELAKIGPLGEMSLGSEQAPVTIIEYASMTCPHCAHFHETTYPELKKRYIDTGKVRFIFREFPLDRLAAAAFMLARCSAQGAGPDQSPGAASPAAASQRYFAMIETLFAQQKEWAVQRPLEPLMNITKQAGFTQQTFEECLKNQQVLDGIEDVRQRAAQKLNVQSTPTFFINGKLYRGSMDINDMAKAIDPLIKS